MKRILSTVLLSVFCTAAAAAETQPGTTPQSDPGLSVAGKHIGAGAAAFVGSGAVVYVSAVLMAPTGGSSVIGLVAGVGGMATGIAEFAVGISMGFMVISGSPVTATSADTTKAIELAESAISVSGMSSVIYLSLAGLSDDGMADGMGLAANAENLIDAPKGLSQLVKSFSTKGDRIVKAVALSHASRSAVKSAKEVVDTGAKIGRERNLTWLDLDDPSSPPRSDRTDLPCPQPDPQTVCVLAPIEVPGKNIEAPKAEKKPPQKQKKKAVEKPQRRGDGEKTAQQIERANNAREFSQSMEQLGNTPMGEYRRGEGNMIVGPVIWGGGGGVNSGSARNLQPR